MSRENIKHLQDIPNIGKAIEKELNLIGIKSPQQLIGKDPYKMPLQSLLSNRVEGTLTFSPYQVCTFFCRNPDQRVEF